MKRLSPNTWVKLKLKVIEKFVLQTENTTLNQVGICELNTQLFITKISKNSHDSPTVTISEIQMIVKILG